MKPRTFLHLVLGLLHFLAIFVVNYALILILFNVFLPTDDLEGRGAGLIVAKVGAAVMLSLIFSLAAKGRGE